MSKIYLITKGEYSDYRVCGAFSTEEKAKASIQFYTGSPEIEEYELDQAIPLQPGWWTWQVVLDENGDTPAAHRAPYKIDPCPEMSQYWPGLNCRAFYVCAKDENHAFKIANERRAQIVALGLWKSRCKELSERQNQMTDTVYSVKKFGLIEIHIRKESILGPRIISVVAPSVPLTNPTPELLEEIGKTWLAAAEYLADLGPK